MRAPNGFIAVITGLVRMLHPRSNAHAQANRSYSASRAYSTAAGQAALNRGCLIVAAAGNSGPAGPTEAPANSPTIMSVASLSANLQPSTFSCIGKIDIAADLTKAGLKHCQVLEEIGIITGVATPASLAKLRQVDGVAAVEEEDVISVGPPDSTKPS